MISKELLNEVFIGTIYDENEPFTEIKFDDEVNEVLFYTDCEYWNSINIYDLANMCKEWAKGKGFQILSGVDNANTYRADVYYTDFLVTDFEAIENTETEAIFKACEWILEQKRK